MKLKYENRYAAAPEDVKSYDTQKLRDTFLVQHLFEEDALNLVHSHYDRFIVGGALPVKDKLELKTIDLLKAEYFLERRELGIINVGGTGTVYVNDESYQLGYKESLYVGQGNEKVYFESENQNEPAKFYLNSAPAHKAYPTKKVTRENAEIVELGSPETANHRILNKLIVNSVVDCCQLQMGMTELQTGSVWNTLPSHVHDRRMEAYFYFEVPEDQAVCHFMGQPTETRHLWMHNEQAVISPTWSIHSGAGTSNYTFIWGMAGENLDYGDMDVCKNTELR